jgi:hypothetical protein
MKEKFAFSRTYRPEQLNLPARYVFGFFIFQFSMQTQNSQWRLSGPIFWANFAEKADILLLLNNIVKSSLL